MSFLFLSCSDYSGIQSNRSSGNRYEKDWETLKQARFKEFVKKLPYGLDMIAGERGVKFSGGQRHRIAIARSLYEGLDPSVE